MAGLACPMAHHGESRMETRGNIDPPKQTANLKKKLCVKLWHASTQVFVVYSVGLYSDRITPTGLSDHCRKYC